MDVFLMLKVFDFVVKECLYLFVVSKQFWLCLERGLLNQII